MRVYVLECSMKVPVPVPQVFAVFENASNLARITPAWLNFRMAAPGKMHLRKGAVIDYTIRWMHIPVSWRTRITQYDPPLCFVDEQVRGPYRLWRHRHTFEACAGGTLVGDRVEYALPFGGLGRLAHRLLVARQLRGIFKYRQAALPPVLGLERQQCESSPILMRVGPIR
jgi:ligand-binding SRPBCC domain-containing protein